MRRRLRTPLAVLGALALFVPACALRDPYADRGSTASRLEREKTRSREQARSERILDEPAPAAEPRTSPTPTPAPTPGPSVGAATGSSTGKAVAATSGKGQYLYRMEKIGTPAEVVARAKATGLRHLVIRASNPEEGFYIRPTLEELLPLAHAAGIKVVAYDGPAMEDIPGDVARAMEVVSFRTAGGDRVDALGADIEKTRAKNLYRPRALEYARRLRAAGGPGYPLVAIVMNPNYHMSWYPFAELATAFDIMSPMDYWTGVTKDGAGFVRKSVEMLGRFGKPVSVIGQAYPIEGKGTYPSADVVVAALDAAKTSGAVGMSFWSWDTTRPDTWSAIKRFSW